MTKMNESWVKFAGVCNLWALAIIVGVVLPLLVLRICEIVAFVATHSGYGVGGVNTIGQEVMIMVLNPSLHAFSPLSQVIIIGVVIMAIFSGVVLRD